MLGVGFVPSLRVGEKDPKYDQYQRSNNPMPKVYYLSASQARPMLTTGVVRSGLVMTVLREDGTFTVEASILGGADLMESREKVEATELLSLCCLFGSEAGESSERLEAGEGVWLLCRNIDMAISLSV